MNFISKEALQRIREQYPEGARVELTKMNDPYSATIPTRAICSCRPSSVRTTSPR